MILLDQTLPNQTIRLGKRPNSLNLAQILFELKLKKEFVQYGLKLKLGRGRFQAKSIVTHYFHSGGNNNDGLGICHSKSLI